MIRRWDQSRADHERLAELVLRRRESTGRLSEAIRALESVLQRHPNHRESLTALAQYELKAGRRDQARRYVERLVQLEPQDPGARELRAAVEGRR